VHLDHRGLPQCGGIDETEVDVPVGDTRKMLGETAARCYGVDLDSLRPISEKIGPTPDDLGQDRSLETTEDELRRGEWWKDEYQVRWGG